MRKCRRRSSGRLSLRVLSASWISTAQRTAWVGLANSASTLSPAVLMMRPSWNWMMPSITERCAERMRIVPSSSAAIMRL